MLASLASGSAATISILVGCFILVLFFEFSNGVTGGIAGTMVGSGAGVQRATLWMIAAAWILTLPATIALSCGIFYLLS